MLDVGSTLLAVTGPTHAPSAPRLITVANVVRAHTNSPEPAAWVDLSANAGIHNLGGPLAWAGSFTSATGADYPRRDLRARHQRHMAMTVQTRTAIQKNVEIQTEDLEKTRRVHAAETDERSRETTGSATTTTVLSSSTTHSRYTHRAAGSKTCSSSERPKNRGYPANRKKQSPQCSKSPLVLSLMVTRVARALAFTWDALGAQHDLLIQRERVFGEEHRDVLSTAYELAELLDQRGRHEQARDLFEDALGRRWLLGENHPDTRATADELTAEPGHTCTLGHDRRWYVRRGWREPCLHTRCWTDGLTAWDVC
ncbi:tetratricopeptide repeat protein [Frankia sp. AgPm24]|uniref:tetratricopeptide repeat protein n=1 Tax=Frankia sp. AgPm24 TaxID=631128 RepID=UPI00200BBBB8|nr:tetratricopeptide repeat protein [Frankia sp. AgPm24]MCK9920687.1 tetratricopeptide repeat protein [Frankia sp. AgPm24]